MLLKNISKKSDSLVLIKDKLKINENKIHLEIGKTFIEAYLTKENLDQNENKNENENEKIMLKKDYLVKIASEKNEIIEDDSNTPYEDILK